MTIKDCANAFSAGEPYKGPYYHTDGKSYWLYDSQIATVCNGKLELSYCGWFTPPTHNHLKQIAAAFGKKLPYSYGKNNQPPTDTFIL
jgi:hypothetical protein